jgi:hypothetical protein
MRSAPSVQGRRAPNRHLERTPSPAGAIPVRPDDRRGGDSARLVLVGSISGRPATPAMDLRVLHRHRDAVVTSLIPGAAVSSPSSRCVGNFGLAPDGPSHP